MTSKKNITKFVLLLLSFCLVPAFAAATPTITIVGDFNGIPSVSPFGFLKGGTDYNVEFSISDADASAGSYLVDANISLACVKGTGTPLFDDLNLSTDFVHDTNNLNLGFDVNFTWVNRASTLYSTSSRGDVNLAITSCYYSPQVWYDSINNRTYVLWMQRPYSGGQYGIENYFFYYDHAKGTVSDSVLVTPYYTDAIDLHGHGAIITTDSGTVMVAYEQLDNDGHTHNSPMMLRKFDSYGTAVPFGASKDITDVNLEDTITVTGTDLDPDCSGMYVVGGEYPEGSGIDYYVREDGEFYLWDDGYHRWRISAALEEMGVCWDLETWYPIGTFGHYYCDYDTQGSAVVTNIKVTTETAHGFSTDDTIYISPVAGISPSIYGLYSIVENDETSFYIQGQAAQGYSGTLSGTPTCNGGSFTTELGDYHAYPHLFRVGSRIYVLSRTNADAMQNPYVDLYYTDDEGVTWSSVIRIVNLAGDGYYWAYSVAVPSSLDDKLRITVNEYDNVRIRKIYYLESSDGVNWSNIDDSHSQDVSDTSLSRDNLIDYYLLKDSGSDSIWNEVTSGSITPSGRIYFLITEQATGSYPQTRNHYIRYWDGGWLEKTITPFSGISVPSADDTGDNAVQRIFAYDDNTIDVFAIHKVGSARELERWHTGDGGDNWLKAEDITSNSSFNHNYLTITANASSTVPWLLASSYKNNQPSSADIRLWTEGYHSANWDFNACLILDFNSNGTYYTKIADFNVLFDSTIPTTLDNDGNNTWQNTDANIQFSCSDNNAGCKNFYYSVDDTNYQKSWGGDTNIGIELGTDGNHSIWCWSGDRTDNNSTAKLIYSAIDKTAPGTVENATVDLNNTWQKTDANIQFSCSDSAGGCRNFYYSVDDVNYQVGWGLDENIGISLTTDANHEIFYWSDDNASGVGDNNENARLLYVGVDKTNPSTPTVTAPSTTTAASATITYTTTDATSGIKKYWAREQGQAWVDNGANTSYEFSISSGESLPTTHTYCVKATDNSDNNSNEECVNITFQAASSRRIAPIIAPAPPGKPPAIVETKQVLALQREFIPLEEASIPVLDPTEKELGLNVKRLATEKDLLFTRNLRARGLWGTTAIVKYSNIVTLTVENVSEKTLRAIELIEGIPKELAESAAVIASDRDFIVIEEDPVIKFLIGDLGAGEKASVSYDFNASLERGQITEQQFNEMSAPVALIRLEEEDTCMGMLCDDFNPCTRDYCIEGECVYAEMSEGAKCGKEMHCMQGKCVKIEKEKIVPAIETVVAPPWLQARQELMAATSLALALAIAGFLNYVRRQQRPKKQ